MAEVKKVNISGADYYNKKITVKCTLSGKSLSPYCIPKKLNFVCIPSKNANCSKCKYAGNNILDILPIDENILRFVDAKNSSFSSIIQEILKVTCKICAYTVLEVQNIERIYTLPVLAKEGENTGVSQISYFLGTGLESNTTYNLIGYTTVEPTSQVVTHMFLEANKEQTDIDAFVMTQEKHLLLEKEFSVTNKTSGAIYEYLISLYKYYAHNITKIYDRFDLHLAIDLAYKSPLAFYFDGEFVYKGWIDAIVVGDTRCGKGLVAEGLKKYFGYGEVISGEICSTAGIVGGLQQHNKSWVLTWGAIPRNDTRLVIIDEASAITQEEWSRLSRVRSEGIAEITKIVTQSTNARTRLVFLSNPINKTISNYSYGIQALSDIFKAPEDIARFDFALVVAHNEVSSTTTNSHKDILDIKHNQELEKDLISWIWSRKPKEIIFSQKAIDYVYEQSKKIAKQYTFTIPLIQSENIRIKIAKLAICFAGRVYSTIDNGKSIYVDDYHVECAIVFLNLIYKKESSGYYAMSQLQKGMTEDFNDKDFTLVEKYINAFGNNKLALCKCLIANNDIRSIDISEHVNLALESSREVVSTLLKNDCLIKKGSLHVKSPAFTVWLKRVILNKERGEI